MRGKVATVQKRVNQLRITPAYAGKSLVVATPAFPDQDHPRLCGEKVKMSQLKRGDVGSPPPMRGKVRHCRFSSMPDRITPAYAGKSSRPQKITELTGDHPRLCGEK